jgi:hypothetical protein
VGWGPDCPRREAAAEEVDADGRLPGAGGSFLLWIKKSDSD